jgi:hypothetical protein
MLLYTSANSRGQFTKSIEIYPIDFAIFGKNKKDVATLPYLENSEKSLAFACQMQFFKGSIIHQLFYCA